MVTGRLSRTYTRDASPVPSSPRGNRESLEPRDGGDKYWNPNISETASLGRTSPLKISDCHQCHVRKMSDNLTSPVARPRKALQCRASAKRTGKPCQGPAVNGWRVCRVHGAAVALPRGRPPCRLETSPKVRRATSEGSRATFSTGKVALWRGRSGERTRRTTPMSVIDAYLRLVSRWRRSFLLPPPVKRIGRRAIRHGVADRTAGRANLLAAGPLTVDALATATGIQPSALQRVLRPLTAEGNLRGGGLGYFCPDPPQQCASRQCGGQSAGLLAHDRP